jgi:hypothetical protein
MCTIAPAIGLAGITAATVSIIYTRRAGRRT